MNYLIITSVFKGNGADYKGLDLDKITYPVYNTVDNTCALMYEGDTTGLHKDVTLTTEEGYNSFIKALPKGLTLEERVALTEKTLNDILLGGV
ncbi:MAG TPA: hypothetical protein VEZ91_00835 [Kurthia gibsonii]|nr:hypothetical protein [Kurthia gibsonii]